MQSALHITTKVLLGGKVELQLPPDSVGDEIEIFVVLPEKKKAAPESGECKMFCVRGSKVRSNKLYL
jgi:hypothetical protein